MDDLKVYATTREEWWAMITNSWILVRLRCYLAAVRWSKRELISLSEDDSEQHHRATVIRQLKDFILRGGKEVSGLHS